MGKEKCIISKCVKKETSKGTFYIIALSDGRKGTSYDDLTGKIDQELELDIKEGKLYEGVMLYYFNLPKSEKPNGKFPVKDWSYEKRRSALECAVTHCNKKPELTVTQVIECAEKFYGFLNTK